MMTFHYIRNDDCGCGKAEYSVASKSQWSDGGQERSYTQGREGKQWPAYCGEAEMTEACTKSSSQESSRNADDQSAESSGSKMTKKKSYRSEGEGSFLWR